MSRDINLRLPRVNSEPGDLTEAEIKEQRRIRTALNTRLEALIHSGECVPLWCHTIVPGAPAQKWYSDAAAAEAAFAEAVAQERRDTFGRAYYDQIHELRETKGIELLECQLPQRNREAFTQGYAAWTQTIEAAKAAGACLWDMPELHRLIGLRLWLEGRGISLAEFVQAAA